MRVANFGRVWFWLLSHAMRHVCMHACAAPPPPSHALTHWLADLVMGLSLTQWLCYVTTTQTALPASTLPPPRPPLVSMQFLAEKALALHLPTAAILPPSFYSGGWKRGARGKGREEDVWSAQGRNLTSLQFWEHFFNKQNMYNCSFSPQKSYICFLFNHSVGL